jgi:outer membrane protein assembly factor BamB
VNRDGERLQFHGDPVVYENTVFVGTDGTGMPSLWAFDLTTGALRWKFEIPDERAQLQGIPTSIIRSGSDVCGVTFGDEFVCVDARTGKTRWTYRSESDSNPGTLRPSPALVNDRFVFAALDRTVHCLRARDGKVLWKQSLPAAIRTSAVADRKWAYVGSQNGHVYRLTLTDGAIDADIDLGATPYFSPLLRDSILYMYAGTDEENELIAVDRNLKRILWKKTTAGGWSSPRPYALGKQVIAGTNKGALIALDAATGRQIWSRQLGNVIRAIGVADDALYVGSLSGRLTAIRRPSH